MKCDFNDPESVVRCFIASMNGWELEVHRLRRSARNSDDPSSYQVSARASLEAVYSLYCTAKSRPHDRNGSFQNPPEYDLSREAVVACERDGQKASVITYRDSILGSGRYRYCLKYRDGKWLIDTLKQCMEDGKESPHIL